MMKAPYFHLAFRPNITLVSTVRRFIGEFYRRLLVDQEVGSRLALATHELLENAVAYASSDETEIRIEIVEDQLVIKTWNCTLPERIAGLKTVLEEMNEAPDADLYYQQMLLRTSKRTEGSGLGLARIRAECEMKLGFELIQDRVCMMATTTIDGGLTQ
jgi:hypothetical protein